MTEIKNDFALLRHDVQKLRGRVSETERRISDLEDTVNPLLPKVNTAGGKIATLEDKVDDLEYRLRRNNLRLVGLPERVEGSDPVSFMESWLEQEFGCELLSPCFVIERAHRVPGRPLPAGNPPCTMVIHLLNYRHCDSILRAARLKGSLKINNAVSLYPDYSVAVRNQRAQYQLIKQWLREHAVQYSMLFPATLRVFHQDNLLRTPWHGGNHCHNLLENPPDGCLSHFAASLLVLPPSLHIHAVNTIAPPFFLAENLRGSTTITFLTGEPATLIC